MKPVFKLKKALTDLLSQREGLDCRGPVVNLTGDMEVDMKDFLKASPNTSVLSRKIISEVKSEYESMLNHLREEQLSQLGTSILDPDKYHDESIIPTSGSVDIEGLKSLILSKKNGNLIFLSKPKGLKTLRKSTNNPDILKEIITLIGKDNIVGYFSNHEFEELLSIEIDNVSYEFRSLRDLVGFLFTQEMGFTDEIRFFILFEFYLPNFIDTWVVDKGSKNDYINYVAYQREFASILTRNPDQVIVKIILEQVFKDKADIDVNSDKYKWVNFILDEDSLSYYTKHWLLDWISRSSFQYSSAKFIKQSKTAQKIFNFSDDIQKAVVLVGLFFESFMNSNFDLETCEGFQKEFIECNKDICDEAEDIDFIDIIQKAFDFIQGSTRPIVIDELKKNHVEAGGWYDIEINGGYEENIDRYRYLHACITRYMNNWCTSNFNQFQSRVDKGNSSAYFLVNSLCQELDVNPIIEVCFQIIDESLNCSPLTVEFNEFPVIVEDVCSKGIVEMCEGGEVESYRYPFLGIVYKEGSIINMLGDEIGQSFSVDTLPTLANKIQELNLENSQEGAMILRANGIVNSLNEKGKSPEYIELTDEELQFVYNEKFLTKKPYFKKIREDLQTQRANREFVEFDLRNILKKSKGIKKPRFNINIIINCDNLTSVLSAVNQNIIQIHSIYANSVDFGYRDIKIAASSTIPVVTIKFHSCQNIKTLEVNNANSVSVKSSRGIGDIKLSGVKTQNIK
ncbi:hypothetical protein CL656_06945 [bacterium]|nr:hypothetical protein [bacterium]|tara:strand:+ start:1476 stop:3689 length:2214 start_codon:yes stop_codon:yes gene_type:complete